MDGFYIVLYYFLFMNSNYISNSTDLINKCILGNGDGMLYKIYHKSNFIENIEIYYFDVIYFILFLKIKLNSLYFICAIGNIIIIIYIKYLFKKINFIICMMHKN